MANDMVKIWDNHEELGSVLTSEKTKLVVGAYMRDGIRYVGIKQWYLNKSGEWKPGLDWCCFAINPFTKVGAQLPDPTTDLLSLINQAHDTAVTMDLFNEEKAVYRPKAK